MHKIIFFAINIFICILKGISPFKMHKIIFFARKKIIKKLCVPTLPKIFRPVTRNTLIFLFGLTSVLHTQSMEIEKDSVAGLKHVFMHMSQVPKSHELAQFLPNTVKTKKTRKTH